MISVPDRSGEFVVNAMTKFLETMADLWPIKLRMLKADQDGDLALMDEIKPEIIPVVKRAEKPLKDALLWRIRARQLYESDEAFREQENKQCSEDFARFINHWCYTSDPRLPPIGLPSMLPFVLWPKQEEFLLWVHEAYEMGRSWLAEKSRGWGITWLMSAYYVWHWTFHDGFIGGFGSRDKEAVDKLGDPDTIFAKVRFLIYNLPDDMRPESYRGKDLTSQSVNDNYMRITNMERGSTIRGEGGDNIGAGGRASIYVVDEAALVAHPEKIDDSLSYTTNCRGDVSTVRGMNSFGEKRHSGRVRVWTSWFYNDPSKYKNWREDKMPTREECPFLDHEFLDKGELVVNQELLIDYERSVEDSLIPADWIRSAVDFDIPAQGDRQSGFDIAGSGSNQSVYTFRVGPVLYKPRVIQCETVQEGLETALAYAEEDKADLFAYDHDGIGDSVWGHIKFTERRMKFDLYGIHGNAGASEKYLYTEGMKAKEKLYNKRAENWWDLRERFRKTYEHRKGVRIYDYSELISIPDDTKLITQLSQPKRLYRSGKIRVESKIEMRQRGVISPDVADSTVDAFSDPDREAVVMKEFNYKEGSTNINEFEIDPESPVGQQYVALVNTEDTTTHALCCWWLPAVPVLKVFWEFVTSSTDVKSLVSDIKLAMCSDIKPIREWVCNEEMLKSLEGRRDSLWYLYRKEGVSLRKNHYYDYETSIVIVNKMFANGIIQIHPRCEMFLLQLTNWRVVNGKPQGGLGLPMALCQLVTRLRAKKEIKKEYIQPRFAPKRPYKNSMGHFSRVAKEDPNQPFYMRIANSQVKQYGKRVQTQMEG